MAKSKSKKTPLTRYSVYPPILDRRVFSPEPEVSSTSQPGTHHATDHEREWTHEPAASLSIFDNEQAESPKSRSQSIQTSSNSGSISHDEEGSVIQNEDSDNGTDNTESEEDGSQDQVGRAASPTLVDQRAIIPDSIESPHGTVGKPGYGGYTLRRAMPWTTREFNQMQVYFKARAIQYIDPSVPFSAQNSEVIKRICAKADVKFPILTACKKRWATKAFLYSAHKILSSNYRKEQQLSAASSVM